MKETDYIPVEELTYAHGSPVISGDVKTYNDDFVVKEISGFQPDGHGDHGFITLTKTGLTTQDVCKKLQRFCHVQQRDIGFAGLKDKNAVTTQTFSVNLAGKPEPDWQSFTEDGITVNQVSRHPRKLKRGVLKGNRFELLIRNLKGDLSKLEGRMNAIAEEGVPNYFGQQRFGNEHSNIQTALKWLKKDGINPRRNERSILISSIRSMIFNAILDRRVKNSSWAKLLKGEVINLDGTERHFQEAIDDLLLNRNRELDVHPTGALAGMPSRALKPVDEAGDIEEGVLINYREWIDHLVALKLEHARRPLRIAVRDLEWKLKDEGLKLAFSLRSGAYATVVLREIVKSEGL
jgi:tRNA pseudouridine13 synthase